MPNSGKDDAIKMLIISLQLLNLIPVSGNGKVELVFQDGVLLDTVDTKRTRLNIKVADYL
jgi:hypothetical protein